MKNSDSSINLHCRNQQPIEETFVMEWRKRDVLNGVKSFELWVFKKTLSIYLGVCRWIKVFCELESVLRSWIAKNYHSPSYLHLFSVSGSHCFKNVLDFAEKNKWQDLTQPMVSFVEPPIVSFENLEIWKRTLFIIFLKRLKDTWEGS